MRLSGNTGCYLIPGVETSVTLLPCLSPTISQPPATGRRKCDLSYSNSKSCGRNAAPLRLFVSTHGEGKGNLGWGWRWGGTTAKSKGRFFRAKLINLDGDNLRASISLYFLFWLLIEIWQQESLLGFLKSILFTNINTSMKKRKFSPYCLFLYTRWPSEIISVLSIFFYLFKEHSKRPICHILVGKGKGQRKGSG